MSDTDQTSVGEDIKNVGETISENVEDAANTAVDETGKVFDAGKDAVEDAVNTVTDTAEDLKDKISEG